MRLLYPANLELQPDGGFTVLFPDFPEAITEGDTEDEALLHAQEVLSLSLRARMEEAQPIPAPSAAKGKGTRWVAPDAQAQSAALLRMARGDKPLSDVARAMETSWASAQRLEDPRHWPSLKQLDRAARVLGKRLVLSLE